MALIPAICTQCGAQIKVDDQKEAGICEYCGTAFITEKAINNYNVTNNIQANTVNIYSQSASDDFETEGSTLIIYKGKAEVVEIPRYIQYIAEDAFRNNNYIKKIILSNVNEIGSYAFYNCPNLQEIVFNNIGVSIYSAAFVGSALKELKFPEGTLHIFERAFSDCKNLEYIEFPSSMYNIHPQAFLNCCSLKKAVFNSSETRVADDAFWGCPALDMSDISHRFYTPNLPANTGQNGCYVATCVYGSYDCPPVWILRRFRDDTLDATWYGRAFIKFYYTTSPALVKWFGETAWFKTLCKLFLNKMIANLKKQGVIDTPYSDKY